MPLSKKICRACYVRHGFGWDERDEIAWKTGWVKFCPAGRAHQGRFKSVAEMDEVLSRACRFRIDGEPPEKCPYLAEQTVSQDDT